MSHAQDHPVTCSHPGCNAAHPGSKWDNIQAGRDGWFHQRDGNAYCPKHVPKWVNRRRARLPEMLSDATINIIIGIITVILSISTSMFISGTRWGRVESTLLDLQQDRVRQSDINSIRNRLSRIEGMFTLTIKKNERGH